MRAWLIYSVVRVLVFAVPFAILFALGLEWWAAALIAAAIGFCVSYIFLARLRERVTLQLAERAEGRKGPATTDEQAEDADLP